jgi:membrane protein implicated in regulation of membrane protease activity
MPSLSRLGRTPWLAGALLLALAAGLAAPIFYFLGPGRWPLFVGMAAALLLVFGAVARRWQSRPLPRPRRSKDRSRFRLVPGGKGNGHAHDDPAGDSGDEPRWLM